MARLYEFPNRSVIEDEACEWLIKLDRDEPLSAGELDELRGWVTRSQMHRREFERLARLWGRMDVLAELAVSSEGPEPRHVHAGRRLLDAVAGMSPFSGGAMALALVAVTAIVWTLLQSGQEPDGVYMTDIGEVRGVSLNDGTLIQLNTNSRIDIDFSPSTRQIRLLRGEAYFDVAHNPDRPFVVFAGNGAVEAVGTAFSVYLQEKEVKVTVTEGEVALALVDRTRHEQETDAADKISGNSDVRAVQKLGRLGAGQSTTFSSGIGAIRLVKAGELTRQLAWREGLLMFSGEPLEEVVSEISRYTDLSIEISDPQVRNLRIGGQFKVGQTEAMFEVLESSFGIQVTRVDRDTVRLSATKQ